MLWIPLESMKLNWLRSKHDAFGAAIQSGADRFPSARLLRQIPFSADGELGRGAVLPDGDPQRARSAVNA